LPEANAFRRLRITGVEYSNAGKAIRAQDSFGTEFVFFWNEATGVSRADGTRLSVYDLNVGHVIDVVWVERNAKRIPLSITIQE